MPCCEGIRPVKKLARAGEHTGVVVKAFVMRTPLRAMRFMLGVRTSELPYACWSHCPWSSEKNTRILGDLGPDAVGLAPEIPDAEDVAAAPRSFRRSRRSRAIQMILLKFTTPSLRLKTRAASPRFRPFKSLFKYTGHQLAS